MAKYLEEIQLLLAAQNTATEELRKAERQVREIQRKEEQRAREAEALARKQASVEAEIRDHQLRASGQHLEADLQQIRRSFAQRMAEARAAGKQELAERLAVLRNLREQEIRERHATAEAVKRNAAQHGSVEQSALAQLRDAVTLGKAFAAINVGIRLAQAGTAAWHGDTEAVRDILFSIPFGIGQGARAIDDIIARMAGWKRSAEEVRREQEAIAATLSDLDRSFTAASNLESVRANLAKQRELEASEDADASGRARRRLEAENEFTAQKDTILAAFNTARSSKDLSAAFVLELEAKRDEALANARASRDRTLRRLAHEEREEAMRAIHDARERIIIAEQEARLHARARADEIRQVQRADLAAEMRDINIEATNIQRQIAELRGNRGRDVLPAADQNRFLTGVRQETQQQDRAAKAFEDRQIKVLESQLREIQESKKLLQELNDQIKNGEPVIVGVFDTANV